MRSLVNIAANSLRRGNISTMAAKVVRRIRERRIASQREAVVAWCRERAESWPDFAAALDPALWDETQSVCAGIARHAQARLDRLEFRPGGAGHYPLPYFLTRRLKPAAVVETGVAAGWSSQAILTAMAANGKGHLYSSDFPYFRMKDPEQYIGYVVEDRLKDRWTLLIKGDRRNLPEITRLSGPIDLFHFDSDKSLAGRELAWNCVKGNLSPHAVVLFDDIQDNFHFRDIAASSSGRHVRVFEFEGKFAGMIAPPLTA